MATPAQSVDPGKRPEMAFELAFYMLTDCHYFASVFGKTRPERVLKSRPASGLEAHPGPRQTQKTPGSSALWSVSPPDFPLMARAERASSIWGGGSRPLTWCMSDTASASLLSF